MSEMLSEFHLGLVALSYGLSMLGALTGLLVSRNIPTEAGGIRIGWLLLSAVVLGFFAVWSMHFVGMVAYQPGIAITYDTLITVLSVVPPVIAFAVGLWVAYTWAQSKIALGIAGAGMGLGIAGMHYLGMAGMRMAADMHMAQGPLVASVMIGMVASAAALYFIRDTRGALRYLSAPIMGLAVCALHYTGMYGVTLAPNEATVRYFEGAVTGPQMVMLIIASATALTVVSLGLAWWADERRTQALIRTG
ncbi:hypothetical protein HC341_04665 [Aquisalimonas sp. 2447]|uniref:MHYT domain-containing protein n=1 Tax=Aquisalimonas sp. 2447 TaxID=2740807 RepID=UPI0014324E4F|nr:MHYT domain-containing protein [Aquisalimonas sp. 2447]QIT54573.1 hypothetical protein HC341_04665 [Aquisalimonas sp. 2447]